MLLLVVIWTLLVVSFRAEPLGWSVVGRGVDFSGVFMTMS